VTELQFDPMKQEPPKDDGPGPRRNLRDASGVMAAMAAIAAVAVLGLWWFLRPHRAAEPATGEGPPQAPAATAPTPPAVAAPAAPSEPEWPPLPELEQSDAYVRALAAELFGSEALDRWLASGEELIHRGVRALLAISQQRSARRFLDFLPLEGPFTVQSRGGQLVIAEESYRRYDRFVDLFVAVDSGRLVRMLERIDPLLSRSMDENALPGTGFVSILRSAIDHLLSTPVPAGELAVVSGEDGLFRFVDPEKEALSPPQKQLLRLGPENGRRTRAKLEEIRLALEAVPGGAGAATAP
jgi:hypothetical protein